MAKDQRACLARRQRSALNTISGLDGSPIPRMEGALMVNSLAEVVMGAQVARLVKLAG